MSYGFKSSVDDFGTEYSSLSYLSRLPLDKLKIDIFFVRRIVTDSACSAIIWAILSLSQVMSLETIAEGVETEEQKDCFLALGCHSFQGYLSGKPMVVSQFEEVMRHHRMISGVSIKTQ